MSESNVHIPIPTEFLLGVANTLKEEGSDRDPVEFIISMASDFLHLREKVKSDYLDLKGFESFPHVTDELVSRVVDSGIRSLSRQELLPIEIAPDVYEGYRWKNVLLPDGTKLRIHYKGKHYYAKVEINVISYEGKHVSPSEFAHEVTGTNRNAWRDLEVLEPGNSEWQKADTLRPSKHVDLTKEILIPFDDLKDSLEIKNDEDCARRYVRWYLANLYLHQDYTKVEGDVVHFRTDGHVNLKRMPRKEFEGNVEEVLSQMGTEYGAENYRNMLKEYRAALNNKNMNEETIEKTLEQEKRIQKARAAEGENYDAQ